MTFDDAPVGKERKLVAALGLKRTGRGVRGTAFSSFYRDRRDFALARDVWRTRQVHPTRSLETIVGEVAEHAVVTEAMVVRAWGAWSDFLTE